MGDTNYKDMHMYDRNLQLAFKYKKFRIRRLWDNFKFIF